MEPWLCKNICCYWYNAWDFWFMFN